MRRKIQQFMFLQDDFNKIRIYSSLPLWDKKMESAVIENKVDVTVDSGFIENYSAIAALHGVFESSNSILPPFVSSCHVRYLRNTRSPLTDMDLT